MATYEFNIKVIRCKKLPTIYGNALAGLTTDIRKIITKSTIHLKNRRTKQQKFEDILHECGHIVLDTIQTATQHKIPRKIEETYAQMFEKVVLDSLKEA